MNYLLFASLGFISGLFWIWVFFGKVSFKGKFSNITLLFFLGMLAALAALVIQKTIFYFFPFINNSSNKIFSFFQMFFIVAPIEEYFKCATVELTVYKSKKFNLVSDGIIYAIACALGFGAMENILYFIMFYEEAFIYEILLKRSLLSILGHAAFSGLMGFYMGLAKQNQDKEQKLILSGLAAAILLHGLYNFLLSTNTIITFLIFPEVFIIMLILENRMNSYKDETTAVPLKKINFSFIIIPVLILSTACFFLEDREVTRLKGKNIIEETALYNLYDGISIDKAKKILGPPVESQEFFGRNEVIYIYVYKTKFGDYKRVKLIFIEGKLHLKK